MKQYYIHSIGYEMPEPMSLSEVRAALTNTIANSLQRGCESGNTDARIIAKMHCIPQDAIDDARPVDFLPFLMGYMCAMNNGTKETAPDTSPEYFRGYDRGVNVKCGKCPAPSWIKTQTV